jgi:hypothetical protein
MLEALVMSTPSAPSPTLPETSAALGDRFRRLANQWKAHSRHLSNPAQMAMLPAYQRIIGMGWPAVPFILEELRQEPGQWFWALEAITEENPVPPAAAGIVREMARAWVEWGQSRGLIAA